MPELVFSGVQPTSQLHLGNYIGALKQMGPLQETYRCLYCVVDLHAITVPQEPAVLRQNIIDVVATYLAVGLDPKRCALFIQSEVPEHAELSWILGTLAKMGEMERMTQFKDKSQKGGAERAGLGLFSYPVLMAADILLYGAAAVPIGEDQTQHLELARTLARRFNETFGETFVIPRALVQKTGARIMSLQDPSKKMSKSDPSGLSKILLTDDADTIRKKIMKAVTDSGEGITFDSDKKPALANLLTIYHHLTGEPIKTIEAAFAGKGYGDFKKALAEAVIAHLSPITKKIEAYKKDQKELTRILDAGRDAAKKMAAEKMNEVKKRVGLGRA